MVSVVLANVPGKISECVMSIRLRPATASRAKRTKTFGIDVAFRGTGFAAIAGVQSVGQKDALDPGVVVGDEENGAHGAVTGAPSAQGY